ncbi:MAG TPA: hypothetical protein VK856_02275 [Anaerolineaceae bacterium]|nr:hypothetical protein [Anaerolineaceae bacterium]
MLAKCISRRILGFMKLKKENRGLEENQESQPHGSYDQVWFRLFLVFDYSKGKFEGQ